MKKKGFSSAIPIGWFRRRNLKIIFFLVFLPPTPSFFFDHHPHSYRMGEKIPHSPSPWLFQIVFIDIIWKTNYLKISNWNISNKHRQNLIKLAPYLEHILLNKAKVIESFSVGVYSRILINKIDKIGLTLTMFLGFQKFKTAFPGLFTSFPILLKHRLLLYSAKWLFQIVFIDIVWKTNFFKISNWNISNKHQQNFIKLSP